MNKAFDVATYALMIGGILVMTRPQSQGPKLVDSLVGGFVRVVQAATGQKIS